MKKGINIWSFPRGMKIRQCMEAAGDAGFEGIELALSETGEMSLESTDAEIVGYRKMAADMGLELSGLASGLYWSYSLTSNNRETRDKGKSIVRRQLQGAALLGGGRHPGGARGCGRGFHSGSRSGGIRQGL